MKRCSRCRELLSLDQFAKKGSGLQSHCKPCNRIYQKAHYQQNKQRYLSGARIWKDERKKGTMLALRDHLSTHPCVDCGEDDPIVLEFDHVRGTKVAAIAALVADGASQAKVFLEVSKCDVRCANCHRRKSAHDLNWYAVLDR